MLEIVINPVELWSDLTNEYSYSDRYSLQLEHSLFSISEWEKKWKKSFINTRKKTYEETIDYIRCMTLTQNIPDIAYTYLSVRNIDQINKYMEDTMTATKFTKDEKSSSNESLTSEIIYCSMTMLNIPWEAQYWHINRLLTLIRVCNLKNQPQKKMKTADIYRRNRELNDQRRKQYNTKG